MKGWQGFRTIPPPAPALVLEFTHSQGTSTCCLPFFTPRSRNPIWVKGLGGEADSKKKSRLQHARFPPSHCSQVSPWTLGIKASQQTFWKGVQSDTREEMLGEAPTTTFVQESLHIRAWRRRVWGRFHSCWFLLSPPLQILLSCSVSTYEETKTEAH